MFPPQLSTVFLVISAWSEELRPLQIHRAWGKCRTIWRSSFILSKGPRSVALGFLRSVGYKPYVCHILRTLGNFCGRSSSRFSIVQTERVGLWGRTQRPWVYLPVSLAHQVLLLFCFLSAHGGIPSKPSAKLFSEFCFYCLYLFYL